MPRHRMRRFRAKRVEKWLVLTFFFGHLAILAAGFHQPGTAQVSDGLDPSATLLGAVDVQGQVVDSLAGTPVELARVTLLDKEERLVQQTITDSLGYFRLRAPGPGQYWLKVQAEFYEESSHGPFSLTSAEGPTLTLKLRPLPVGLRGLVVDAERYSPRLAKEGVYDRMANGLGAYFDREQIEARPGRPVSELIAVLPMVELWPDTLNLGWRVVFRRRQFESFRITDLKEAKRCFPQVFLNGVLLTPGGEFPAQLDRISLNDLGAVEVYESPAFLPGRFHGIYAKCGTVVLWTR